MSWIRTFETRRRRRFDAYMIFSEERGCIVDYLGDHQHLAVDIEIDVAANGGIRIRSGEQRFYEGWFGFRFPIALSGTAEVCEWFDEDQGCFRIQVEVRNRRWGPLFGYRGQFEVEWLHNAEVPASTLPRRVEPRE